MVSVVCKSKSPLVVLAVVATLSVAPAASAADAVSYNADVASILGERCVVCHRAGEIAPMSLRTYAEVRPWAKAIRQAVAARTMPPWHADSTKVDYLNDRRLSDSEVETLVAWVEAGAPEGSGEPPAPPVFTDGWRLGEPDLVFEPKTSYVVPVTDEEIPYQSMTYQIEIQEDLWIQGWELRPRRLDVVHHANLVRSPSSLDGKSVGIASAVMKGGDYIGSYLPGHSAVVYPEGMAYLLEKGSHLGIQVHYVSVGEEVDGAISFGVHLAEGRIDKRMRVVGTDYRAIEIPPGEARYAVTDEVEMLYDVTALTSGIHMHLRGAAYRMEGVLPSGDVHLITDVPKYDFNWQTNYILAQPVELPKGSKLRVTSVWDNSASNPYNPDPSATVRYGPWTDDEMVNSWAHVVLTQERLGLDVSDGRVIGHFDDALEPVSPFLIQSLPAAPVFKRNAEEIESHERKGGR